MLVTTKRPRGMTIYQARLRHGLGILVLLALLPATRAGADNTLFAQLSTLPEVYKESFEKGRPDGWKSSGGGDWHAEDGRYALTIRGEEPGCALYSKQAWSDFFAETEYLREPGSTGVGGIVALATPGFKIGDEGSAYYFGIRQEGETSQFAVFRQLDGKPELLQDWMALPAIQPGTNKLAVLSYSGLLQFYINGEQAWESYDTAMTSGMAGLFGQSAAGVKIRQTFDNMAIRSASEKATTVKDGDNQAAATPEPTPAPEPVVTSTPPAASPSPAEPPLTTSATATPPVEAAPAPEDKSPLLRPGLMIQLTVYVSGKREIDGEVKRVSDNSQLELPLIGPVSVAGMTLNALNTTLQTRYQEYFIEPQVLAEFVVEERPDAISPWGSVVVLGRVKTPGRVNIPPTQDLTVSGAIQQAGGLDTSAKASAIRLTRRKPDGGTERITVDFTAVGRRGSVENDLILRPGDQIFVPESVF